MASDDAFVNSHGASAAAQRSNPPVVQDTGNACTSIGVRQQSPFLKPRAVMEVVVHDAAKQIRNVESSKRGQGVWPASFDTRCPPADTNPSRTFQHGKLGRFVVQMMTGRDKIAVAFQLRHVGAEPFPLLRTVSSETLTRSFDVRDQVGAWCWWTGRAWVAGRRVARRLPVQTMLVADVSIPDLSGVPWPAACSPGVSDPGRKGVSGTPRDILHIVASGVIGGSEVRSADGTRGGFRPVGAEPRVAVLRHPMCAGRHHAQLATEFSMRTLDRRAGSAGRTRGVHCGVDAECAVLTPGLPAPARSRCSATATAGRSRWKCPSDSRKGGSSDRRCTSRRCRSVVTSVHGGAGWAWLPERHRVIAHHRNAGAPTMHDLDLDGPRRNAPPTKRQMLPQTVLWGAVLHDAEELSSLLPAEASAASDLACAVPRYTVVGIDTRWPRGERSRAQLRGAIAQHDEAMPNSAAIILPKTGRKVPNAEAPREIAELVYPHLLA